MECRKWMRRWRRLYIRMTAATRTWLDCRNKSMMTSNASSAIRHSVMSLRSYWVAAGCPYASHVLATLSPTRNASSVTTHSITSNAKSCLIPLLSNYSSCSPNRSYSTVITSSPLVIPEHSRKQYRQVETQSWERTDDLKSNQRKSFLLKLFRNLWTILTQELFHNSTRSSWIQQLNWKMSRNGSKTSQIRVVKRSPSSNHLLK